MLPIIFSLGPFTLRTLTVFSLLALIVAAFLFWRKGREEHYSEMELFDGFLLATVVGTIGARIGFIVINFSEFGLHIWKWFNIVGSPGFNLFIGLVVAGLYIYRYAQRHKWDVFEITDFWVTAVCFGLAIMWLGIFFDGTSFGYATHLPWGMVFPGVFEKHHPVQLYFFILYGLLAYYLSWAEYHYRTFMWYRAGKNTAQTGFLTSIFICLVGLISLVMVIVRPPQLKLFGLGLDVPLYAFLVVFGLGLLIHRSGRSLLPGGGRRPSANINDPT